MASYNEEFLRLENEIQSLTRTLQQKKGQNLESVRNLLNSYERLNESTNQKEESQFIKNSKPTGAFKEVPLEDRILICYFLNSGKNAATVLKTQLTTTCELLPVSNQLDWNEEKIERQVASSTAVVVILSKHSLAQSAQAFVLRSLLHYDRTRSILVHDASTCYFPNSSEIPPDVVSLFGEKAINFLADYASSVVEQIIGLYDKQKKAIANFQRQKSNEEDSTEDVHTRLFLSHRRATAQAIAGKMYEGFKDYYSVFLDSETQFKIHKLEYIVSKTDLFVWILSDGYLDSEWCTKELHAAINFNIKIIVVRDANYKVPADLTSWSDLVPKEKIYEILNTSPTLVWMAEYSQQCIDKIRKLFLGAKDAAVADIKDWIKLHPKLEKGWVNKLFDEPNPLCITNHTWKHEFSNLIIGLTFNYGCTITSVDLKNIAEDQYLTDMKGLPLTHLSLASSAVTDAGLSKLAKLFPNLIYLNISDCKNHKTASIKGLCKLEILKIEGCNNLFVEVYSTIVSNTFMNLRQIYVSGCFFTNKDFEMLALHCPKLERIFCGHHHGDWDRVVSKEVRKSITEYNPNFDLQRSLRSLHY